jgi:hypothetical protein
MYSLHEACKCGNAEFVKKKLNIVQDKNIPFISSCQKTYKKINKRKELNKKNDQGDTPFMLTCRYGQKNIIEIILNDEEFNTLNEKNNDGQNPFLLICKYGYKEIIETIMKRKDFLSFNEKS